MAIDNFDPAQKKELDQIRTRAFFAAAATKLGELQESNIIDAYDGDLDAAAEALDITCEFEGAVFKLLKDKLVNDAMDKADAEDNGVRYDLEDVIRAEVDARLNGGYGID